ncbi:MAG: M23 family metallopeptidase [Acidobacteriota bacterium]|jgi:murein DD-endopeptidase MepM/ murein hydrolase activator NlpD|nr:M23 family metallopeptidase [Acidobacteriota bacterium]
MKTPDWHRLAEKARDFGWSGGWGWPTAVLLPVALLALSAGATFRLLEMHPPIPVEVPESQPEPEPPVLRSVSGEFQKNQTATEVLLAEGLSPNEAHALIEAAQPVYDLAKVHAGGKWEMDFTQEGDLLEFRYPVDPDRYDQYLTVARDETGGFVPTMTTHQFETQVERITGAIDAAHPSLFLAVTRGGGDDVLAIELGNIFASDIDFNTDVQEGDSFRALVERKYLDGRLRGNGTILAATFTNGGKTFAGFRFSDADGKPAYYAEDGRALRKSFLKAPLKIIRITSKFTTARRHPILKVVRPHLGVDYGAPTGTPVQAVGDGTVTSAGWSSGGGGLTITLRHSGGFETKYMHLSRIQVKRGQRVKQGQVIGNVGSSGLATGPHLDFRVYQNGKALDPTKVVSPPGEPVSKARMAEFAALRDNRFAELESGMAAHEETAPAATAAP